MVREGRRGRSRLVVQGGPVVPQEVQITEIQSPEPQTSHQVEELAYQSNKIVLFDLRVHKHKSGGELC